jgi:hypothetical protein
MTKEAPAMAGASHDPIARAHQVSGPAAGELGGAPLLEGGQQAVVELAVEERP